MEMYPHWEKTPKNDADWFMALVRLAHYLRSPQGCPWDREQTSKDFARFLNEESAELRDAYEGTPDDENILEEMGDCLFTLLACMAAAEEEGRGNLSDMLKNAHEKMVRRHAHVFAEVPATTPEEALESWAKIKEEEKKRKKK